MLIKKRDKDSYLVTIFKEELDNIDLKNEEECEMIITNILKSVINDDIRDGIIFLDTYIDCNYGLIMEIVRKRVWGSKDLSIRFNFFLDRSILYEGDYFLTKLLPENSYNIYYYKKKFYIELTKLIENNIYMKLIENTNIIIDKENIKSEGIKV